jgi:hypothetical protein
MAAFMMSIWTCHMPEASSDESMTVGSPVIARRYNAVATAPAMVSPPTTSPKAARGGLDHSAPGCNKRCCMPLRAQ